MIEPVIKWPGSKRRIAEFIVSHMPKHDCYLESHFGSGAVFFAKKPSNVEIINDLDALVVNLFRVLRSEPECLMRAINLTPWSRDEYAHCCNDLSPEDEVERARRLLVAMWQGMGIRRASNKDERGGGKTGWRIRDTLYQSPVPTWSRLPERLRAASERLLDAQIENRPALQLIAEHADSQVLIYADPPYVLSARGGNMDRDGGRLYAHEMSDQDHLDLIDVLKGHPGPVLLSAYRCPLYDENLGWQHVEANARIQFNQQRIETLYLNPVAIQRYESERAQHRLFEHPAKAIA